MIEQILSEYDLHTDDQLEVELISNGLINQTWYIKNANHSYILQKINTGVFKNPLAIAKNNRMIADYLSKKYPDYLFIAPIKTNKKREMVFTSNQEYYRLTPFVERSHTIQAAQTPEQAFEASKQFGKFTRLLADFPVEKLQITLPDFHNLSLRYQQFLQAVATGNPTRIRESDKLISFLKENVNIVESYEDIVRNKEFKLRVTHHDTKISNVLFDDNNKGLCVIDLDTVMPGYFISDVGDMIRTYVCPVSEEERNFDTIEIRYEYLEAVREGYMSEMRNELTDGEKHHFNYSGKFMIYMQAIRFLADYLNNDIYYGTTYPGQNLVRTENQVTLLQKFMKNT